MRVSRFQGSTAVSEVLMETWRSSALWKHLLRICKRFLLIHPVDFVMSDVCVCMETFLLGP